VEQRATKQLDIALKGALGRDQFGDATSEGSILNRKGI
jgi:hypothetical protein